MTNRAEEIGLLLVHGVGEQRPLDHLRQVAKDLASSVAKSPGLARIAIVDDSGESARIRIDAVFRRSGEEQKVRLHLHEVCWGDLGIRGGLFEHVKFWLWGLGQWAAEDSNQGDLLPNTRSLMAMPRFRHRATEPMQRPGFLRELPARLALVGAALVAILTFFTWSVAKQLVAFLAPRLASPSLIFLLIGDVKVYERPGGPGKGSLLDPDLPMRVTIRRRMVRGMTAMAAQPYDRWYMVGHSLGTVIAFNALQETELALPNYLTEAEWQALPARLKTCSPFAPPDAVVSTDDMMPRRPAWLRSEDGIDRPRLFDRLAGFVSYGSPLDKFAALWPRIVCLNRQAEVFPRDCEWVNIHEATDPIAARLDAFEPPSDPIAAKVTDGIALAPKNFACRAHPGFLISHRFYFSPRRRRRKAMGAALVEAIVARDRTSLSDAASSAAISPLERRARKLGAIVQVLGLTLALTLAAGALLIGIAELMPDWLRTWARERVTDVNRDLVTMVRHGGYEQLWAAAAIALTLACAAILISGVLKIVVDAPQRGLPLAAAAGALIYFFGRTVVGWTTDLAAAGIAEACRLLASPLVAIERAIAFLSPELLAAIKAGEGVFPWAGGVLLFTIVAATLFALASRRVADVGSWLARRKKRRHENEARTPAPD